MTTRPGPSVRPPGYFAATAIYGLGALLALAGIIAMARLWPTGDDGADTTPAGLAWLCFITGWGFAATLWALAAVITLLGRRTP